MYFTRVLLLVLALTTQLAEARERETYCTWGDGITEARIDVADGALLSTKKSSHHDAIEASKQEHLPFGLPNHDASDHEHLLAQKDFIIWYDNDLRAPLWTAHHLTSAEATAARERADSFRSDPRLKATWSRSECADYQEPVFDRGHMVPRADMNFSEVSMDQTYLMTNMTPQHCAFNRGIWQVLEQLGRHWAIQVSDTWIVTGAIFDRDETPGRDPDQIAWRMIGKYGTRVAIPSHQYKLFIRKVGSDWEVLSILLPNTDTLVPDGEETNYLNDHVVTLSEVKTRSGFDFLSGQTFTEKTTLWPIDISMPGQLTYGCNSSYPKY